MAKVPVFKMHQLMFMGFVAFGLLVWILGFFAELGDPLMVNTVALAQVGIGIFSIYNFKKKNYVLYGQGKLLWRFSNMNGEKLIELKEIIKLNEVQDGFELITTNGLTEKIPTQGMFKADRKRFYNFLATRIGN